MKRVGSCLRCGACCRIIGFAVDLSIPDIIDWLRARGCEIHGTDMAVLKFPCPHLNPLGDCDLHGPDKPEICQRWPEEPSDLTPGCGFSFTEEEV